MVKEFARQTRTTEIQIKRAVKNAIEAAISKSTVGSSTPCNTPSTWGKTVKKAERALPLLPQKGTTKINKLGMNPGISLESPSGKTRKKTFAKKDHVIEIVKNV